MAFVARTKRDVDYVIEYKGSKITGCPLTNKESIKLRRDFTRSKTTRNGMEEKLDVEAMLLAKFRKMVKEWDFVDEDGNAIPCTDAAKAEFMDLNIVDALEIIQQFDELGAEQEVTDEKN